MEIEISQGIRMSEFRKSKNLSQSDFAKMLDCSQPNLNKIERGKVGVSSSMRNKLIEAYPELNINWLHGGSGRMINVGISEIASALDSNLSSASGRTNFSKQMDRLINLFEQGQIPLGTMVLFLENFKKMFTIQETRIKELEDDKMFLKSIMSKFKDGLPSGS
jgi:transcriptional regulator with XRE-family HTH domain